MARLDNNPVYDVGYQDGYAAGIRYVVDADTETWQAIRKEAASSPRFHGEQRALVLGMIDMQIKKNQGISRDVAAISAAARDEGDDDGDGDEGEATQ